MVGLAGTAPDRLTAVHASGQEGLELSLREALQLNHSYIGTEHILLGLAPGGGRGGGHGVR